MGYIIHIDNFLHIMDLYIIELLLLSTKCLKFLHRRLVAHLTQCGHFAKCVTVQCTVYCIHSVYSISNFDTKNLKNSVYVIPIAAQKRV